MNKLSRRRGQGVITGLAARRAALLKGVSPLNRPVLNRANLNKHSANRAATKRPALFQVPQPQCSAHDWKIFGASPSSLWVCRRGFVEKSPQFLYFSVCVNVLSLCCVFFLLHRREHVRCFHSADTPSRRRRRRGGRTRRLRAAAQTDPSGCTGNGQLSSPRFLLLIQNGIQ